ncbi:MAG: ABC transporter permease [Cyclobacteriaceae bacterium]|nr:ABC transporter permease [Cyclobacteriaceae bacterium]
MNLSYFISKRLRQTTSGGFASIIHKVAVATIAVGLAAAIVSFLIMQGFQTAVKNKIYAFSNHLLILKHTTNNEVEEEPFNFRIAMYEQPERFPFVKHMQEYSHKAGLIKTEREVLGIIFKGVGRGTGNFAESPAFFKENLVEGRFIHFADSGYSKEVVISRIIANKMDVKVGDNIILHFFQNPPRFRKLKVVGLYETNLSDYFDGKVLIGDLGMVQQLNGWNEDEAGGLEVTLDMDKFNGFDLWKQNLPMGESVEENDTLFFEVPTEKSLFSFDYNMAAMEYARLTLANSMDFDLYVESVRDRFIQLFEWLDLIKRQVKILLGIILFVISMNMVSVILILVMERVPMVGVLKALGATNRTVRAVFMYNGMNLIARGLIWGNIIGLGLCWLQDQFKIMKLNPHDYYVSYVPIEWSVWTVIMLNLIIFGLVTLVLLLPTYWVVKISPVKAIRFD